MLIEIQKIPIFKFQELLETQTNPKTTSAFKIVTESVGVHSLAGNCQLLVFWDVMAGFFRLFVLRPVLPRLKECDEPRGKGGGERYTFTAG